MNDPTVVEITPADEWIKIATAVVMGLVIIKTSIPNAYYFDFRVTGNPEPPDMETARSFSNSGIEPISSPAEIDIYIYAKGAPGAVILCI